MSRKSAPRGSSKPRPPHSAKRAAPPAPALTPAPALPLSHPAMWIAAAAAAAALLVSVTFRLNDTDLWQHLAVGRAIWALHAVPALHIWTWPAFGTPDVTPSWGFRILLWPFFSGLGVTGLFAWRWITTLATFAILWTAARRMGARGFTPFVVMVLCGLVYRQRSQVRPETLVAILFALEILILETRRLSGRDRTRWLVLIAWVWANVHISYWLGFALLGIHTAADLLAARGRRESTERAAGLRRDAWVLLAMVAVSFVNPYGWRPLWQPFEYFLYWRHEPIFKLIAELSPVYWSSNLKNGFPLLVALWPLLALWRTRRQGEGAAELATCALLLLLALPTQRFIGFLAIGTAPYLARDLDAWVNARRWPRWTASVRARAALAATACLAIGLAEWSEPEMALGVGLKPEWFPVRACDFMEAHGVRGHGYNHFYLGGYLLWRFWPDSTRLPFMDIHQSGTREDRRLAALAYVDPAGWRALDSHYRFDWALLNRWRTEEDRSLDILDADSSFALVFMDDNAALYARRDGALAAIADSFAYRTVPAGQLHVVPLGAACATDTALRARAVRELERETQGSEYNAQAHSLLANIAMMEGRTWALREELHRALAVDPLTPLAHERLAIAALTLARPREAIDELSREKAAPQHRAAVATMRWQARALLRDLEARRRQIREELARAPRKAALRDSLAAIEGQLAR